MLVELSTAKFTWVWGRPDRPTDPILGRHPRLCIGAFEVKG